MQTPAPQCEPARGTPESTCRPLLPHLQRPGTVRMGARPSVTTRGQLEARQWWGYHATRCSEDASRAQKTPPGSGLGMRPGHCAVSPGFSVAQDSTWPRSAFSMTTSIDNGLCRRRVWPGRAGDGGAVQGQGRCPAREAGTGLPAGLPSSPEAWSPAPHESVEQVYRLGRWAVAPRGDRGSCRPPEASSDAGTGLFCRQWVSGQRKTRLWHRRG